MADTPDFYRARAEEQRTLSAEATLDNVRERCDRAASAWETMAVRAERTQVMRVQREAASAARMADASASSEDDDED